jgi:hypothetical protein
MFSTRHVQTRDDTARREYVELIGQANSLVIVVLVTE